MKRFNGLAALAVTAIISMIAAGCSSSPQHGSESGYLQNGSLMISKPLPSVVAPPSGNALMGFIPVIPTIDPRSSWVDLDLSSNTLSIMSGDSAARQFTVQCKDLPKGEFQIVHKQRTPLWYAPDSYFQSRHLNVPAEGDRSRFRRGALGQYALFINKDTPIHSGPVWTDEIGGIKVSEADMIQLYPAMEIGEKIVIR